MAAASPVSAAIGGVLVSAWRYSRLSPGRLTYIVVAAVALGIRPP